MVLRPGSPFDVRLQANGGKMGTDMMLFGQNSRDDMRPNPIEEKRLVPPGSYSQQGSAQQGYPPQQELAEVRVQPCVKCLTMTEFL